MNGNLTTPAALNGDVRTIPLIDKTLTIEGKCADAKATGDRFDAQAAIIEEHGINIADNAALIQTLSAENGVQDTTLGEHKALIVDNAQKIAVCESGIGELHRKASEAETAIGALQEKATTTDETIADINTRINKNAEDINANHNMIVEEVKPELATAQNDIEALKSNVSEIEETMAAEKESYLNGLDVKVFDVTTTTEKINDAFASYYVKSLHICQAVLDFSVSEDVGPGEVIFGNLPKPAANATVAVFGTMSGNAYPLDLQADGNVGVIRNKYINILSGTRVTGSISYIVAADSYV